jgi:hypothetical protein
MNGILIISIEYATPQNIKLHKRNKYHGSNLPVIISENIKKKPPRDNHI